MFKLVEHWGDLNASAFVLIGEVVPVQFSEVVAVRGCSETNFQFVLSLGSNSGDP